MRGKGNLSAFFSHWRCKHWFRRLFQTAWITATLLSVASLSSCLGSCSQFRMRRPGYSHEWADIRREHISSVLQQLHWLPVSRRIIFKLAVLMYQISRGLDPTYLQDRCRLASEVNSGRRLRSTNVPTFVVAWTRTKLGDRNFAAAGLRLWNSLPGHLHQY